MAVLFFLPLLTRLAQPRTVTGSIANKEESLLKYEKVGDRIKVTDREVGIVFSYPELWGLPSAEGGYGSIPPGTIPDLTDPGNAFNLQYQKRYFLNKNDEKDFFMIAHRTQEMRNNVVNNWDPTILLQAICSPNQECAMSTEKNANNLTFIMSEQYATDGDRSLKIKDYQFIDTSRLFGSVILMDRYMYQSTRPEIAPLLEQEIVDSLEYIDWVETEEYTQLYGNPDPARS